MAARQRIVRIRREYNQWVANETLEDYSLRFTAKSARRWSSFRVANTAFGAVSFLALEAIGGAIALNYGFVNATWAIGVVGLVIFLTGLPIAYHAAKPRHRHGPAHPRRGLRLPRVDAHLADLRELHVHLLRARGGHHGAGARAGFGMPRPIGYLVSGAGRDPAGHARHHADLAPAAVDAAALAVLLVLPVRRIALKDPGSVRPTSDDAERPPRRRRLLVARLRRGRAVAASLIAQIGEQVDFLRFMPPHARTGRALVGRGARPPARGGSSSAPEDGRAAPSSRSSRCSHEVSRARGLEPTQMYLAGFEYVLGAGDAVGRARRRCSSSCRR
jgi:hypothetical protein